MKIIAHRGASGEFPENTLLSIEQGILQQADGVEFDVQYHHSGQFILLHDYYLDKTTNGQGKINDFSLEALQQLDAGNGQILPTLTQALKTIKCRCLVNIEVKTTVVETLLLAKMINALYECIDQAINCFGFTRAHFVISSFNHHLLAQLKATYSQLNTAALIATCPLTYTQFATVLKVSGVNPSIETLNKALVDDAHGRGFSVWVYTVDKYREINECFTLGVDGVFTNYPKQSREYLKQIQKVTK